MAICERRESFLAFDESAVSALGVEVVGLNMLLYAAISIAGGGVCFRSIVLVHDGF